MEKFQQEFHDRGVVCVRGALDRSGLELAEAAYNWSLRHPGPGARRVLAGKPGAFYQDHANPNAFDAYRPLLCDTGLSMLVASVLGTKSLWLLYEQIWLKEGEAKLPTPWHQDLPYIPLEGDHAATVWVNLDPVEKAESLEFVVGSHRGPLFNPTAFNSSDPSAAMYADGVWPSLPDIDAARDHWPIISWALEPGDLIIIHMAMLHGGAPTRSGGRRRTMSLRFFGENAFCAPRPEDGLTDIDQLTYDDGCRDPIKELALMPAGTPFRHSDFQRLL